MPTTKTANAADDTVPAIETHALMRRFDQVVAVDALELRVEDGTFFGLLGSNGAGKTTTIRMLTTLLAPSSGSARVAGFDVVRDAREVRRHIGYVPQLVSSDSALTARENLSLSAKLYGVPRAERAARIDEALEFMGLAAVGAHLVRTYSGGMIRRLEIAQALLHRPAVVFLDEPTVGLDPVARRAVWERLRELRTRWGTSLLLTTHDMEEAAELCEEVAIMHRGRVVVAGAPRALAAALGPEATLDDVFVHHTGGEAGEGEGGRFGDVSRTRRAAQRLG